MEKSPQDVTWIEQLMGRRESLRAGSVIAVSASKFTKETLLKQASELLEKQSAAIDADLQAN